jgi:glucose-1-phosphatase
MGAIKNIIFDLGGVLLDIDYQKTIDAFAQLGIPHFETMFSQFKADALFEKLETGQIAEEAFYMAIQQRTSAHLTHSEIEAAWNALILDFRTESLQVLDRLSKTHQLFLLSNTNHIHQRYFKELFRRQTGKPSLDAYFVKAWYSNEVGLRKPNADIYEYALQDGHLQPGKTVFIDDTLLNVEAARKLGIQSHHLLPGEKIENLPLLAS